MRQSGVPASERPKTTQLKVQRPGGSCKPSGEYSVQCRLDLENFAKDPPAGVSVFEEHFICTAERVQLAFELKLEGVDAMLKEKQFHSFLMDYTFSTCREGLLLGAIGPVGVQMTRSGPRMRFFPTHFAVSSKEDANAQRLLFDLFMDKSNELQLSWTDGFFDCSNLHTVSEAVMEYGLEIRCHRCLQHVFRMC
eukprot:s6467_g2.t1